MELQFMSIHGHKIAYRTAGEGPVIALIHGMAGSSATWLATMPALSTRFTVVALDLPGHGESDKPRGDYSLGNFANGVRDLMMSLGHQRWTVVGQSFGGGVAMQLAYQFPERCERLVLVSSGGLGQEVNFLLRALSFPGAEYLMPVGITHWLKRFALAVTGWLRSTGFRPSPTLAEVARSYTSLLDADTRRAFIHTLRSVIDTSGQRVSAEDRLYLTSDMPTLIVWGNRDPVIPVKHAHSAHQAMPASRLELFEDTGHYPHCEDPQRFAQLLTDFILSTSPAALSPEEWNERLSRAKRSVSPVPEAPIPEAPIPEAPVPAVPPPVTSDA